MLTRDNFPDAHLKALAEAAYALADVASLPYSLDNCAALTALRGELNRAHSLLIAHEPKAPAPANPRPWYQVLQLESTADLEQIRSAYWQLSNATIDPSRLAELSQAFEAAQAALRQPSL